MFYRDLARGILVQLTILHPHIDEKGPLINNVEGTTRICKQMVLIG